MISSPRPMKFDNLAIATVISYMNKTSLINIVITFHHISSRHSVRLVHPAIDWLRQALGVDVDWSHTHTRHEATFSWRHKGPATSQLTDLIKRPFYSSDLIEIYRHMDRHDHESIPPRCRNVIWVFTDGTHYFTNNRHGATITTCATKRYFLIWMTTLRHPT